MRLFDTSFYHQDEVTDNYLIEVLPVNRNTWVTFNVDRGFNIVLNSSNLNYARVNNSSKLLDLPDGIYEIKQSYKPNALTSVSYYHLRTSAIHLKYVELLCKHFSDECKKDRKTYVEESLQLTKIKQYLDAAEYEVSEEHDKDTGIRLYNKATDLIKTFENDCRC